MALDITEISANHFEGGRRVTGGGSAGKPDLAALLIEHITALQALDGRAATGVADNTALAAIEADSRTDRQIALVESPLRLWWYNAASVAAAGPDVVVPDDNPATGRWEALATPGQGAYTTLSAQFVQPAVAATVVASVVNTSWLAVGMRLFIVNGGYYEVTAIGSLTSVTVRNLGYAGNAAPAATVANASAVVASGAIGPNWPRGVGTLVAGTATISNVTITAQSRVRVTPLTSAGTAYGRLEAPVASYVVGAGTGSFVVNSQQMNAAGVETNDTSTFLWEIIEI